MKFVDDDDDDELAPHYCDHEKIHKKQAKIS